MRKSSPTILIILVHSSYNAGDLALLEGLVSQLKQTFDAPRILVSANWPAEPYFERSEEIEVIASPWIRIGEGTGPRVIVRIARLAIGALLAGFFATGFSLRFSPHRWKTLFEAYQQSHFVIGVAGNQFYSTGYIGWPLLVSAFGVELAHLFKKPFYTMPQSIGPFKRRWERWVMRRIYGKARHLFFREQISVQLAHQIGIKPEKIHFAPDPAFGFPAASQEEGEFLLQRYNFNSKALNIGITLIPPMGRSLDLDEMARYYSAMTTLSIHLIERFAVHIYFFNQVVGPTNQEDDRIAVRQVMSGMGEAVQQATWVNEILTPQQLKACFGLMDFFIASRLHSGIFALAQGVPTMFIGYLTKTRGVLSAIGLEDWVIDLSKISVERVVAMATQAWLDRESRAAVLTVIMPDVISQSLRTVEWIARDYEKLDPPTTKSGQIVFKQ